MSKCLRPTHHAKLKNCNDVSGDLARKIFSIHKKFVGCICHTFACRNFYLILDIVFAFNCISTYIITTTIIKVLKNNSISSWPKKSEENDTAVS